MSWDRLVYFLKSEIILSYVRLGIKFIVEETILSWVRLGFFSSNIRVIIFAKNPSF